MKGKKKNDFSHKRWKTWLVVVTPVIAVMECQTEPIVYLVQEASYLQDQELVYKSPSQFCNISRSIYRPY